MDAKTMLPKPAAVLERTWRGSWFVGEAVLSPSTEIHEVYTAEQLNPYVGIVAKLASLADGLNNSNSSAEEAASRLADEARNLLARA